MICEICGNNKADRKVFLEGTWVWICEKCANKLKLNETKIENESKKYYKAKEVTTSLFYSEEVIDDKFYIKLRKYRESKKLKQKDMAKLLGIKESLYKGLEEGRIKPSIDLAKKIEKIIGEKIIIRESTTENYENKDFKLRVADVIEFEE